MSKPTDDQYLVTVHYGGGVRYISKGIFDSEAVAVRHFKELSPKINFRGPKPVVRLWRMTEQRKARRNDPTSSQ